MRFSFFLLTSLVLQAAKSFHQLHAPRPCCDWQRYITLPLNSVAANSEGNPKAESKKKAVAKRKAVPDEKEVVKPSKPKRAKRRAPLPDEPPHWTNSSDPFSVVLQTGDGSSHVICKDYISLADCFLLEKEANVVSLALTIRGHPLPLRRHRTNRGFMYNPSAKTQASFKNQTSLLVFGMEGHEFESVNSPTNQLAPPLFTPEASLAVTLILRLRRPLSHFRSSKRESCTLKANAPASLTSVTRTDVDNLAKFVLDACNGLLYFDDKQIQSLHVIKQLDNEGPCLGSTHLYIKAIDDSMEDDILQHAVQPYTSL